MKKRAHAYRPRPSEMRARLPEKRRQSKSSMKWLIITAICVVTFLCVIGIASAAQANNGPALDAKQQGMQQQIDAARAHMRPKTGDQDAAPTAQPAPARQEGISNVREAPFAVSIFTVRNNWQGPVGQNWVLAYAGAKTNQDGTLGQGGVVLYTETANAQGSFDLHPQGIFLAPKGTTVLTITAEQGNLLTLHSASGQTLTFNLLKRQFQ